MGLRQTDAAGGRADGLDAASGRWGALNLSNSAGIGDLRRGPGLEGAIAPKPVCHDPHQFKSEEGVVLNEE